MALCKTLMILVITHHHEKASPPSIHFFSTNLLDTLTLIPLLNTRQHTDREHTHTQETEVSSSSGCWMPHCSVIIVSHQAHKGMGHEQISAAGRHNRNSLQNATGANVCVYLTKRRSLKSVLQLRPDFFVLLQYSTQKRFNTE